METTAELKYFTEIISQSKHLVAFTGAGCSAESGIPTYRGEGGLWTKYDPDKFANYDYFIKDPTYFWSFFKEIRLPILEKSEPNDTHRTLARLEVEGNLKMVITQNIDGLHQLAGQKNVCELHGNTRQVVCLTCAKKMPFEEVGKKLDTEMPPLCACGGLLKPDVVLFGEALPQKVLLESWQAAQLCDTFLVVGSSLVVQPAAQIPLVARKNGAKLVIINLDPTPLDSLADLVINQKSSDVLQALF